MTTKTAADDGALQCFEGQQPQLGLRIYLAPQAQVIGRVELGDDVSIWPTSIVRGDVNHITIGARSNIQDGSVLHVTHDSPYHPGGFSLAVGDDVTVGHRVILHGCEVGNRCLIGMGATVMDGVTIEDEVMLGAGSLVPPGKVLEGGYLWVGSPVRRLRPLSAEERQGLLYSAAHYVRLKDRYLSAND